MEPNNTTICTPFPDDFPFIGRMTLECTMYTVLYINIQYQRWHQHKQKARVMMMLALRCQARSTQHVIRTQICLRCAFRSMPFHQIYRLIYDTHTVRRIVLRSHMKRSIANWIHAASNISKRTPAFSISNNNRQLTNCFASLAFGNEMIFCRSIHPNIDLIIVFIHSFIMHIE